MHSTQLNPHTPPPRLDCWDDVRLTICILSDVLYCTPHERSSLGRVITMGRIYSLNLGACAPIKLVYRFLLPKLSSSDLLLRPELRANSLNHILPFQHHDTDRMFSGKSTASTTAWGFLMQINLLRKVNIIEIRHAVSRNLLSLNRGWPFLYFLNLFMTLRGGQAGSSLKTNSSQATGRNFEKHVFIGIQRALRKASAGVPLSKTNTPVSGCAYEGIKVFFSAEIECRNRCPDLVLIWLRVVISH